MIGAASIGIIVATGEVAGVLCALHAVMGDRSSQGAVAWSMALVAMPFVAVPLYLVFGRSRFHGYVEALREVQGQARGRYQGWRAEMGAQRATLAPHRRPLQLLAERLTNVPFTDGNRLTLLEDGDATYRAMLGAIRDARRYVLVQFYIVRADRIGGRMRDALVERAQAGVKVRFLFDEVGSAGLDQAWIDSLRQAGVRVSGFKTTRGRGNRLQVNFRNHRKLLVVDGAVGFVGGLNLGDEYLDYRDTHLRIEGPAAQHLQLSFALDWYWAVRAMLDVDVDLAPAPVGDQAVALVPTGPADAVRACSALLLGLADAADERLWIATPYFVPDDVAARALQTAALRGVDVRVLLPARADSRLVEWASLTYYEEMVASGARLFHREGPFMHQKVVLVDGDVATVGTVNLDNRSLYLNFEATAVVCDEAFAGQVAAMLERDFERSTECGAEVFTGRRLGFRAAARVARLFSPLL